MNRRDSDLIVESATNWVFNRSLPGQVVACAERMEGVN